MIPDDQPHDDDDPKLLSVFVPVVLPSTPHVLCGEVCVPNKRPGKQIANLPCSVRFIAHPQGADLVKATVALLPRYEYRL